MRTTCPAPGGKPKPKFDTYSAPSGPNVIPVGNVRPVAMVCTLPACSLRTSPVPGVGFPATVLNQNSQNRCQMEPKRWNAAYIRYLVQVGTSRRNRESVQIAHEKSIVFAGKHGGYDMSLVLSPG
jgi:hypothetical protein